MIEVVEFGKSDAQFTMYYERGCQKRIDAGDMTEEDKNLILAFVASLQATADISAIRSYKICNTLSNVSRFVKTPYAQNTIADVYTGVNALKAADRTLIGNMNKPGKLSANTIQDYVKQLKRFYLWLIDEGFCTTIQREKILKIKNPSGNKLTKTPDMLLSEEEINRILSVCYTKRDKALVSVLYESGCRIHEIGKLMWKDVTFDKHFAKLSTAGKTGVPRLIPLTASRSYLAAWKDSYCKFGNPEGDSPVFLTGEGKSFTYTYLKKLVCELCSRAGITKHITPHIFRHSRITNLIRAGVPQTTVSMMMWGTPTSDQLETYLHLVNNDVEKDVAKLAGIKLDEEHEEEQSFKPRVCPRCLHTNGPDAHFCSVCGAALTKETAIELEEMKEEIHADERYVKMINELQEKLKMLESMIPSN